jgi:hypothetical protein
MHVGGAIGIAAIDVRGSSEKHFVVIGSSDGRKAWELDPALGRVSLFSVRSDSESNGVPALLVSRNEAFIESIEDRPRPRDRLFWASSSGVLSIGLIVGLVAVTMPSISHWTSIVFCAALSARKWVRGVPRQRTRFFLRGLTVGLASTLCCLFVYREFQPLTVQHRLKDLGALPIGSKQEVTIVVENRSLFRQRGLKSVIGSCACLEIEVADSLIPPLSATEVTVSFFVTNVQKAVHTVLVTQDSNGNTIPIQISLSGYESATIRPTFFDVGEFPQGVVIEKVFNMKVANFCGPAIPAKVEKATPKSPFLTPFFASPQVLADTGMFELTLKNETSIPLGQFTERVVVSTIEKEPRTFVVAAHGQIVPPVRVYPRSLFLQHGLHCSDTVNAWAVSRDLEIASVGVVPEGCCVARATPACGGDKWNIVVELPSNQLQTQSVRNATLMITTTSPVERVLSVPIHFLD